MLQDQTTTQPADAGIADVAPSAVPAPVEPAVVAAAQPAPDASAAVAPTSDAAALQTMGFSHLIHNLDFIGWTVLIVLCVQSLGSWVYIVINAIRNLGITARMERVISTFWETPSAADAAVVITGNEVVRGQWAAPAGPASYGGRWLDWVRSHPYITAGVVAAAIATPIAIAASDDDGGGSNGTGSGPHS